MRKLLSITTVAGLLLFMGMSPALAGTNGPTAKTSGSSVKFYESGDKFRICDTDPDGDSVYAKFRYAGSGGNIRLNWTGGGDTCTTRSYNIGEGKIVYYKSCEDDAFNDTCSDEVTGVA